MKLFTNICFPFFILVSLQPLTAQSLPEFVWAFKHPLAAFKINQISKQCQIYYDSAQALKSIDNFYNGGTNDALRHIFFMSAFSQKIKVSTVRALGKAHERGNKRAWKHHRLEDGEAPDSVSTVMDLFNNEVGLLLGSENARASHSELLRLTLEKIRQGEARVILRNNQGVYLSCGGEQLDILLFSGTWNIPKCLVSSSYISNF